MESGNKKDLEWKFDVDGTQVASFKELVGLIVISRIVPNLNSKLDDNERKFVEACYNGFGFEEKGAVHGKITTKQLNAVMTHKIIKNLSIGSSTLVNSIEQGYLISPTSSLALLKILKLLSSIGLNSS